MTLTPLPPATNLTDPAAILRQAAVYVRHGWVQGRFAVGRNGATVSHRSRNACAVDAMGAIARAAGHTWLEDADNHQQAYDTDYATMRRLAQAVCSNYPSGLSDWNDAPGRTQAEVVAALEAMALLYERERAEVT